MGSFSLSCGVTNLSITVGDRCVLLPITATTRASWRIATGNRVAPYAHTRTTANLIYGTDIWQPAMLPIHGEYDDGGGLYDIIEDDNTRILEDRYKMTIDEIVSIICDGRNSVYDSFSNIYSIFFKPKDLYEECFSCTYGEFPKNKLDKAKEFFDSLDIRKCKVRMNGTKGFTAIWRDNSTSSYGYGSVMNFLEDNYKKTGELAGVPFEDRDKCNELMCTGGMFVLEDVWKQFAVDTSPKNSTEYRGAWIGEGILLNLGFVQDINAESRERYYLPLDDGSFPDWYVNPFEHTICGCDGLSVKAFSVEDLLKQIKKLFKISLRQQCDKLYKGHDLFYYSMKNFITILDKKVFLKGNEHFELLQKQSVIPKVPVSGETILLNEIYRDELMNYIGIKEYFEFCRFCHASHLLNVIWTPPFSGSQCGCYEAEAKRVYITNKIVKERLEERYDEDEVIDENECKKGFWKNYY